jgi:hypothetical protein
MRRITVVVACLVLAGLLAAAPNAGARRGPNATGLKRSVDAGRYASVGKLKANAAGMNTLAYLSKRELKKWALDNRPNAVSSAPNYALECTKTRTGKNTNLNCDHPFLPSNEPDIEVDPEDADHMIASWNDYESCCDGFATTFDGGETWYVGDMSTEDNTRIGSDPVTVFDPLNDTAIHTSLNFQINGNGEACDGDLVASPSTDGGMTWETAVVVYGGQGCDLDATQIFNDKEWVVTDTNPASPYYGRTYVTWSRFLSYSGVYAESAIWESHSDDGGYTWSAAQEISGSSLALCTYQEEGPAGECDENQFSVPTVAPDGTVYVAFQNDQNEALWEPGEVFDNQYLMVKSTDGGATWSAPSFVVGLEDGSNDYPINASGRQTLTGMQMRVNSAGNIVADDVTGELYLVFADNRNGNHDTDPVQTNVDVFGMYSDDGGATWFGPELLDGAWRDQWFPWVDAHDGQVAVAYNTRRINNPTLYDYAVIHGTIAGIEDYHKVSGKASHPNFSLFFRAGVAGCRRCATFHGDYTRIAYGPDGELHLVWTDMRRFFDFGAASVAGHTENIFYTKLSFFE